MSFEFSDDSSLEFNLTTKKEKPKKASGKKTPKIAQDEDVISILGSSDDSDDDDNFDEAEVATLSGSQDFSQLTSTQPELLDTQRESTKKTKKARAPKDTTLDSLVTVSAAAALSPSSEYGMLKLSKARREPKVKKQKGTLESSGETIKDILESTSHEQLLAMNQKAISESTRPALSASPNSKQHAGPSVESRVLAVEHIPVHTKSDTAAKENTAQSTKSSDKGSLPPKKRKPSPSAKSESVLATLETDRATHHAESNSNANTTVKEKKKASTSTKPSQKSEENSAIKAKKAKKENSKQSGTTNETIISKSTQASKPIVAEETEAKKDNLTGNPSDKTVPEKNTKKHKGVSSATGDSKTAPLKPNDKTTNFTSNEKSPNTKKTAHASALKRSAKEPENPKSPPKKKKKMNFQDRVLNHMLWAFKPFTLKTLAAELKSTDTILNHVMLTLTDKGLVTQKESTTAKGRTKTLIWANHEVAFKSKEVTIEPVATDEERTAAHRELQVLRSRQAELQEELNRILATPSNQQLVELLAREEAELKALHDRLNATKERIQNAQCNNKNPILRPGEKPKSAAMLARERDPRRLQQRINHMRDEWKKRKDKCVDVVELLADGMDKKPKTVWQLLDLETDEQVNAVMPPKYDV